FDESEVLVGERQDRNLCEIHLLLARQHQQKIERSLETFDVDDQSRLIASAIDGNIGFEGNITGHHHEDTVTSAKRAANCSRAAASSIGAGERRAARAASARRAASPESHGLSAAPPPTSFRVSLQHT